jgi:hypothetical protein
MLNPEVNLGRSGVHAGFNLFCESMVSSTKRWPIFVRVKDILHGDEIYLAY